MLTILIHKTLKPDQSFKILLMSSIVKNKGKDGILKPNLMLLFALYVTKSGKSVHK